ncbi:YfcC family protein [Vagococcus coleopterorum]|uniref:YfcC family protein n=1 Tax=Vagococcus coleopterorum TaxID=2714946 RepID=A0A6G8AMV5_9ENTE|nr:YfcC family protein [Vagococcus coleopterorum]QIL46414.1 YfcC family protein [Vagococcus coleopterorum]
MKKKKISFPSAYTVILIVLLLVMALTYFIPAGKFETIQFDPATKEFVITDTHEQEAQRVSASQQVLDDHQIKVDLAKFEDGSISKPVAIPGSYQELDEKRPNAFGALKQFLHAPIQGLADSIGIITFVLILGGIIGVINKTGAFNAGMNALSIRLKGKEKWLIIIISVLIAAGGTTFGLAEETVAFYPILVPIFMAAGYDALVAIATIYLASCVGTMASTVNPFSVVIASDTAGIPFTQGMSLRLIMLTLALVLCMAYIIRYGEKVRKNAEHSLVFDQKEELEAQFLTKDSQAEAPVFDIRKKIMLAIFALGFVVMVFGVKDYAWGFDEISALFLFITFIMAAISGLGEKSFVSEFIAGASDLLGVALVIALARGVTIIMEDAKISDTLMQWLSSGVSHMTGVVFTTVLFFVYILLGFFIPSSSGLAVLSMPVMAPLADVVGIDRALIVDAYNWGQGIIAFIAPTGLVLASLAMVNISFDKWLKFVTPIMLAIGALAIILLGIGVFI